MFEPSGIAVNKNTNSPYYGRVFVGNAPPNDSRAGIYKFNADGSPADEGGFSRSYPWPWRAPPYDPGYLYSPWKIAIAQDDTVYINDWSGGGLVLAFDEVISTNYLTVLDSDNYPYPGEQLSGPCVTGGGANTQIWMADANTNGWSKGVVRYDVTAGGTLAADDTGTVVVGISSNGLNLCAYDVAVDNTSNIYVIQLLDGYQDTNNYSMPRVFCFPPCSGQPDLVTNWSIGSADYSLENAAGVAVDPTGLFVAVAVRGYNNGSDTSLASAKRRGQHLLRGQWRAGDPPGSGNQPRIHGRGLGQCRKFIRDRLERRGLARLFAARGQSGGHHRRARHPGLRRADPALVERPRRARQPIRIHLDRPEQRDLPHRVFARPGPLDPHRHQLQHRSRSRRHRAAAPGGASFFQAVVP